MSGLETLPPDQRAVLQLILVQGRGYGDLAATLKLDAAAVRERAVAGTAAFGLPGTGDVDETTRGRVVDYMLGQLDDGERIVAFAELGELPAACRWAQALRERLAPIAREELPEVPASAVAPATNGSAAHAEAATALAAAPVAPAPPVTPQPAALAAVAPAPIPAATPTPAPAAPTPGGTAPPSPPSTAPAAPSGPNGPRPSRLGGAILIAGAAALAIVLAIVLIGGGNGGRPAATGTAQTQANTSTQPSTSTNGTTTAASRAPAARPVAAAVLRPTPAGGRAIGAGLVQQSSNGSRLLAVEAARLAANSAQDNYAIWLQGSAGNRFLGFVPSKVTSAGTFTVSSSLPRGLNLSGYGTLLVTREGVTAVPTTPGTVVLSGPLRSTG